MLVYKIDNSDSVSSKVEQLKSIGLTARDLDNTVGILNSSIQSVYDKNVYESLCFPKFPNYNSVIGASQLMP